MYEIILLFFVAVLIAIFSASLGIGGGIFAVPVLIYVGSWHGIGQAYLAQMAVATSLLMASVLSGSASIVNLRSQMVEIRIGLLFALGSIPGAFLGSLVGRFLHFQAITLLFGTFVLLMGLIGLYRIHSVKLKIIQKNTTTETVCNTDDKPENSRNPSPVWLPAAGILTGMLASLTGVGGGIIMVPLFARFLKGHTIHRSIATSNFSMVLVTVSGSIAYLDTRNILPEPSIGFYYLPMALPILAGAMLGGSLGARFGKRVPEQHLKTVLAVLQIFIGTRMLWKYSGLFG
jgi:uncharacterized membrane protein YfcA